MKLMDDHNDKIQLIDLNKVAKHINQRREAVSDNRLHNLKEVSQKHHREMYFYDHLC